MSTIRYALFTLTGCSAFIGTCALVAALTSKRPLPWEALLAAACSTTIALVVASALLQERHR